nr:hypothetical protein [uncultured archaeon]
MGLAGFEPTRRGFLFLEWVDRENLSDFRGIGNQEISSVSACPYVRSPGGYPLPHRPLCS